MNKGTIAYLITSSDLGGGAEPQVRDLALAMHDRGWTVHAISMLPLGKAFAGLRHRQIPVHSLDMQRGVADPRSVYRLNRLLRRIRPDVLHSHMVHANLLGRPTARLAGVPVVISTRHNQNEGARWRDLAYRLTDPFTDLTTTVSAAATQESIRRGVAKASRLITVPNGIDTGVHAGSPDSRAAARRCLPVTAGFVWLAAGRLTAAKDYPNMFEAFRRVVAARPDVRLLIAGTGELAEQLGTVLGSDPVLHDRVQLLGHRTDLAMLMQGADAFVMSSAWEGLPLVLLEAASSALPIVTTDVGGSGEVVVDGSSGHVVPRADPQALASAMLRVMDLPPAARRAMGGAGRGRVVAEFDLSAIVARWEGIYLDRLERRGARSGRIPAQRRPR